MDYIVLWHYTDGGNGFLICANKLAAECKVSEMLEQHGVIKSTIKVKKVTFDSIPFDLVIRTTTSVNINERNFNAT